MIKGQSAASEGFPAGRGSRVAFYRNPRLLIKVVASLVGVIKHLDVSYLSYTLLPIPIFKSLYSNDDKFISYDGQHFYLTQIVRKFKQSVIRWI